MGVRQLGLLNAGNRNYGNFDKPPEVRPQRMAGDFPLSNKVKRDLRGAEKENLKCTRGNLFSNSTLP